MDNVYLSLVASSTFYVVSWQRLCDAKYICHFFCGTDKEKINTFYLSILKLSWAMKKLFYGQLKLCTSDMSGLHHHYYAAALTG